MLPERERYWPPHRTSPLPHSPQPHLQPQTLHQAALQHARQEAGAR